MKNTSVAPSTIATIPAVYAQLAPSTNDVFAALVICFAYCGYWLAVFAALENDFVSCASTLLLTSLGVRRRRDLLGERGRVPGGEQRAEDRLHDRPAEVALEVGGRRRHPRTPHGHRPGQRVRGGRAREADAEPDEGVAESDLPVGAAVLPEQQHGQEPEQAEDVAAQQREPRRRAPR